MDELVKGKDRDWDEEAQRSCGKQAFPRVGKVFAEYSCCSGSLNFP
jgi:hypothetical protein